MLRRTRKDQSYAVVTVESSLMFGVYQLKSNVANIGSLTIYFCPKLAKIRSGE